MTKFYNTISRDDIYKWEQEYSKLVGFAIELPEDYKTFISDVSNGFSFTGYELYPLDDSKQFHVHIDSDDYGFYEDGYEGTFEKPIYYAYIGGSSNIGDVILLSGPNKGFVASEIDGCELDLRNLKSFDEFLKDMGF